MQRYQKGPNTITAIKGAPESVFARCRPDDEMANKLQEAMAVGYRTIAFACK